MHNPTISATIATRDDDNIWWTLQLLIELHGDELNEIVIVDNSASTNNDKFSTSLKALCNNTYQRRDKSQIPVVYVKAPGPASSCLYKERAIQKATSDYILQMDSHVYFPAGVIANLREYLRSEHHHEKDLVTGPLFSRSGMGGLKATSQMIRAGERHDLPANAEIHDGYVCRGGNIGVWVTDDRLYEGQSFEVQQHGLGAFCIKRECWPGFLPTSLGFGGNETYLVESVRERGGRVMCLPDLAWVHMFFRPSGPPYKVKWSSRCENYLDGAIALDNSLMYDAVVKHLTTKSSSSIKAAMTKRPRPTDDYLTRCSLKSDVSHGLFNYLKKHASCEKPLVIDSSSSVIALADNKTVSSVTMSLEKEELAETYAKAKSMGKLRPAPVGESIDYQQHDFIVMSVKNSRPTIDEVNNALYTRRPGTTVMLTGKTGNWDMAQYSIDSHCARVVRYDHVDHRHVILTKE